MIQAFTPEPIRFINEDGSPAQPLPERFSIDFLKQLHREMVRAREFDRKLVPILRQGRTTFYAQASGMEGTQIGLAHALRPGHDWVWPYYRDHPIGLTLGIPLSELIAQMLGSNSDTCKGRQMPHHFASKKFNFVSVSSSIASQVPPAAGCAMAQKYLGTDEVTVCTFGDGATSEGDWHAGVNMAAVNQAPCVFVCENNQWAISTNLKHQTASENIHIKAKAYGIPGYYVDGNDVVAVLEVMSHVIERSRRGEGAALVECLTYRVGSHSNADADAEKSYRTREEVESWVGKGPITRLEKLLEHLGAPVDPAEIEAYIKSVAQEVDEAVTSAEASGQPGWDIMFDDVYSDKPIHLREQEDFLRREQGGQA